jgi:hypothetical protein
MEFLIKGLSIGSPMAANPSIIWVVTSGELGSKISALFEMPTKSMAILKIS